MISRNALPLLERFGIVETLREPMPRLNTGALKVNHMPLQPPLPVPRVRRVAEGDPPPDRPRFAPWPPV